MNRLDWRRVLVAALLCAAFAEFAVRGPLRAAHSLGWNDFLSPYIQAKAWCEGKDPYSARVLVSLWPSDNERPPFVDAEALNGTLEAKRGMPSPYPLSTLVALSPFAIVSWSTAVGLWISINTASVIAALAALLSTCQIRIMDLRSLIFLAAALALAPLHSGLATANPAILVVSLTALVFWSMQSGRSTLAGILLGLALCLKPTVACGMLLYCIMRRRWRIAGVACGLAAVVAAFGIVRLWMASVPWLASYNLTNRKMFSSGSLDDFARVDAIRFNMINGQIFFYSLLKNASIANLITWLLALALVAIWLWLSFRKRYINEVVEIAAISVLILIPVYHRFYDAALLIWPLAWAFLLTSKRSVLIPTVTLLVPFLFPGPILLSLLVERGMIPAWTTSRWWWNSILLPHQALTLILWSLFLLYWMKTTSEGREIAIGKSELELPPTPRPAGPE